MIGDEIVLSRAEGIIGNLDRFTIWDREVDNKHQLF